MCNITLDDLVVTYDISGNTAKDVKTDGDYTLAVSGSGNFEGTRNVDWNISPATPVENDEKKTTAIVRKGNKLADAKVTKGELFGIDGTIVLEGTFAWVDDTRIINSADT